MNVQQMEQMRSGLGFIAALDQSGGSTAKALALYGVTPASYSNETEMFNLVHEMRTRIIKSPAFTSQRVLGAILFEMTMDREIDSLGSAEYLWTQKNIVPFLKVDSWLLEEAEGVQLMKPIPHLGDLLTRARSHKIFGTKMRSVIKLANPIGIDSLLNQQFVIAQGILESGLVPIIEPEVDINSPEKSQAEVLLKYALLTHLDSLKDNQSVILKLTLPTVPGFYTELAEHPRVLRVVALSGGYSRDEANRLLAENPKLIASFSRALTEGLDANQSDMEFNQTLDASIESIYRASTKN